ncbi:MAG TPA: DUF4097 family beta strand repeat-containing protein [Lapillicoccus sp.]|nr:DUF4097 family beta strand repeat-containing protein [Lapillicoccus sp.]
MTGPQDAGRQDAGPQDAPRGEPTQAAGSPHTFPVAGPMTLTVGLEFGALRVHAEDTDTVTARVWPAHPGRRSDVETAERARIHATDNAVEIRIPGGARRMLFGKPGSVDIEVVVPTGSTLRIDAGYAEVEVSGTVEACTVRSSYGDLRVDRTGRLDVDSQGGTITANRIGGPATVSTTYGRIRIREVAGPTELATSSGDIAVDRATADVSARSAYGQVEVGELVRGSATLSASYGSVTVGIPTGTAAYLDARSDHGKVRSELDRTTEPRADVERATVRARTSYGEITIRRS